MAVDATVPIAIANDSEAMPKASRNLRARLVTVDGADPEAQQHDAARTGGKCRNAGLANGSRLPDAAQSQEEIDALLAEFD